MMNKKIEKIFNHPMFGDVRTVCKNGECWFCLVDVCRALELQTFHVMERLEEGIVSKHPVQTAGGIQQANFVNEDGLYDVIFDSRKPIAKAFRKWVTSEVLPSIRKFGVYMTDDVIENAKEDPNYLNNLMEQLEAYKKQLEENKKQLEELTKKSNYLDTILASKDAINVSQIAQDYGMSAVTFNKLLKDMGVQHKIGEQWILGAEYREGGYVVSSTYLYIGSDGEAHTKINTKWTQKGRLLLHNLLGDMGIIPTAE